MIAVIAWTAWKILWDVLQPSMMKKRMMTMLILIIGLRQHILSTPAQLHKRNLDLILTRNWRVIQTRQEITGNVNVLVADSNEAERIGNAIELSDNAFIRVTHLSSLSVKPVSNEYQLGTPDGECSSTPW